MAGRQLRPLGLGDIFDEGFDLYKRNFPLLALVTVVLTVPLDIVIGVIQFYYFHDRSSLAALGDSDPGVVFSAAGAALGAIGIELIVASLFYAIPFCALAVATARCYLGEPVTLRQAYTVPLRRLAGLFWTALLYSLAVAAGSLICGVGGLWPAVALLFVVHTFALEQRTGTTALKRSAQLTSGNSGRVLGALLLLVVVYFVMDVGIQVPLAYAFDTILRIAPGGHTLFLAGDPLHASSVRRQVVDQVSSGLSDLLITPFVLSVITVLYFDLRVRKEAFDIEVLARDLGYASLPVAGHSPPVSLPPPPPLAAPSVLRGPR